MAWRSACAGLVKTALLGIAVCAAACVPGSDLPPLADAPPTPYTLGSGDKVKITTFGGEQLSGEFQVGDTGKIAFPLLGPLPAAGLSADALQDVIATKLREKNILTDPKIAVEVSTYRSVFVLGEVNRPGNYPYQPGMTLLSAVSTAGGFTYRAETDFASITRSTNETSQEGKVGRQSKVLPGDVVTIFERRF